MAFLNCWLILGNPANAVIDVPLIVWEMHMCSFRTDNTEITYFYLSEMVQSRCKGELTNCKTCRLLNEYTPHS
jgi:hypothetical protein